MLASQKSKAQYSVEFLLFFAILSIAFAVWLMVYSNLNQEAFLERDKNALEDLGKAIQAHIVAASNAHDGFFSDELFIPHKAGVTSFEINNTSHLVILSTKKEDYLFHVPYMIGNLTKGENRLWNVKGVVSASEFPPAIDEGGEVLITACNNQIDDDGDDLIDEEDGGCYRNWQTPGFVSSTNDENPNTDHDPDIQNGQVYNYYVQCKNAQELGFCEFLEPGLGLDFTSEDCCRKTYEMFCANEWEIRNPGAQTDGCQTHPDGCSCPIFP